jgi:predicted transcriptional regulator
MREHPRSFRLSDEALQALERLALRRRQSRNRVVETLLLEADARELAKDLRAELEQVKERVARLEADR